MSTPLVSCIVPVFNGERYLAEALDSVLGQTYRALEVIVVDDGSTDGTPAVVRTFGARVRCVTQPNAGLAAARNRGLAAATAELVAFLDADDLWLPEKIACQMERFRAHPELLGGRPAGRRRGARNAFHGADARVLEPDDARAALGLRESRSVRRRAQDGRVP
jgi:glycosyltransferase involved in cell wall biosynthesis